MSNMNICPARFIMFAWEVVAGCLPHPVIVKPKCVQDTANPWLSAIVWMLSIKVQFLQKKKKMKQEKEYDLEQR